MPYKPRNSFYSKPFLPKTAKKLQAYPVVSLKCLANRFDFSLVATHSGFVSASQVISCQKAVKHHLSRSGFLQLMRSLPVAVTKKSLGARIGKGKGPVAVYKAFLPVGSVLFSLKLAESSLGCSSLLAGRHKLPVDSKVFFRLLVAL